MDDHEQTAGNILVDPSLPIAYMSEGIFSHVVAPIMTEETKLK